MADPRYSFFKALAAFERVEIFANRFATFAPATPSLLNDCTVSATEQYRIQRVRSRNTILSLSRAQRRGRSRMSEASIRTTRSIFAKEAWRCKLQLPRRDVQRLTCFAESSSPTDHL